MKRTNERITGRCRATGRDEDPLQGSGIEILQLLAWMEKSHREHRKKRGKTMGRPREIYGKYMGNMGNTRENK